jgi:hypothetical protein
MNNVGSLSEMVNSSIVVLTRPSVSTFETYERRGNLPSALLYIGIAAVISGILGAIASPAGLVGGLLGGLIGALLGFLVFTYAVFYIGRSQGGSGTFDEVAYTFSLFVAPLTVIGAVIGLFGRVIPVLGVCLAVIAGLGILVVQVYLGYLAVQSSMNLTDRTKAIITLVGAAILTFIVSIVIGSIFGGAAFLAGAGR